jgi:hypothetical protein
MPHASEPVPIDPHDRVPHKHAPEILLLGHARAETPVMSIPVEIRLGAAWSKRVVAFAAAPSGAIPLLESYLRRSDDNLVPERVGPVPSDHGLGNQGRSDAPSYNAAPSDQWVAAIDPGARLELEGLTPGAEVFSTELPTTRPVAELHIARTGDVIPVELRCDTLWIDVDTMLVSLVWRGVLDRGGEPAHLVVRSSDGVPRAADGSIPESAPPAGHRRRAKRLPARTADVLDVGALPSAATPFVAAPEAPSAKPGEDPSRRLPAHVELMLAAMDHAGGGETVSVGTATIAVTDALPFDDRSADEADMRETLVATEDGGEPAAQAQGDTPHDPSSDETSSVGETLLHEEAREPAEVHSEDIAALPFRSKSRELPSHVASALDAVEVTDRGATVAAEPRRAEAALPFEERPDERAPVDAHHAPAPMPRAPSPRSPRPPETSDDAAEDAPEVAVPAALPIETVAAVRVALMDGAALADVLGTHDVSEVEWRESERRLAIEIARGRKHEGEDLSIALRRAMEEERARRRASSAPPNSEDSHDESVDLELYLDVRAELEVGGDPDAVLRSLGLSADEWRAIRLRWTRAALGDRALAAEIRSRLAEKRRLIQRTRP